MHTQEKWLVDREDYCICVERDGDPLTVANLGAMDHNGIKWVIGEETWANAYLLRSAPELLASLEAMIAKARKQNWNDQYPEVVEQAAKAIAAAKAGYPAVSDGDDELEWI
jgi:hypothetical protein